MIEFRNDNIRYLILALFISEFIIAARAGIIFDITVFKAGSLYPVMMNCKMLVCSVLDLDIAGIFYGNLVGFNTLRIERNGEGLSVTGLKFAQIFLFEDNACVRHSVIQAERQ